MKYNTAKDKTDLKHVAIIMDGNGRWARKRLLPRSAGHREGLKAIERVTKAAKKLGIPYMSFFAFSTENWNRPKSEVDSLMNLLKTRLPELAQQVGEQGARLVFSGNIAAFDDELRDIIVKSKLITQDNTDGAINICLNYGGRQEILQAVNSAVRTGKTLSENEFRNLFYNNDLPDPDLLIRSGGEKRISNFLLYQLAYTELYFLDRLWPDFSDNDFLVAIEDYNKRNRRYGKL